MGKRIMYQTETKAVVKVWGLSGTTTETIALATDLLSTTMVVDGTPAVDVNHLTWSITKDTPDLITITRTGGEPMGYFTENGQFDFSGSGGWTENAVNTADIIVTIVGSGVCYLTLRKSAGYKSKIEPETFGSYDNTAAVGS